MNIVVRCSQGHLFTTRWIPGVSFKAVRLGRYRIQRCPVGDHWAIVTPVGDGDMPGIDTTDLADDGGIA